jgi:phosphoribosylformylglycinamidine (FGAM) synthase PurS component
MTAKVFVTLKKGVLDLQGKAVEQSLARLVLADIALIGAC